MKWKPSHTRRACRALRDALYLAAPALLVIPAARPAGAQAARDSATTLVLDVASEDENQLRYLQSVGEVPLSQWSVRGFGPREIARLVAPDSTGRVPIVPRAPVHRLGGVEWQRSEVTGTSWYNSAFAFGNNDGAVWRGRGATLALRGGMTARYGPLTVQLQPLVFWAENREFPMMAHVDTLAAEFSDPLRPRYIDRPQRFGDGSYARLDPGQSTVRLDLLGTTVGFSTANQWWGPMSEWPYLLSNNAAGFPHLFLGSATPWNVWVGEVHGRVLYGRLEQSGYATPTGVPSSQYVTGIVASFRPRGVKGLEIGAARLFELTWPSDGPGRRELLKPFEGFLKVNLKADSGRIENSSNDNQLASAFVRWVLPESGFEVYAELGREDHSWDTRDFYWEPDHSMTAGLGFRKAWTGAEGRVSGVTAELFDMDPSILNRHRPQDGKYMHTRARLGHTNRGQVLGAGFAAINGSGTRFAWERYEQAGEKLAVSFARMVVRQRPWPGYPGEPVDVQYALTADRTIRLRGARLKYGLTGVYELNRYLADDATNLQALVELSW